MQKLYKTDDTIRVNEFCVISLLAGRKIARKRFVYLIQQLCLPSNPFDEWPSLCFVFEQIHKHHIFLQKYKKFGSVKTEKR